MSSGSRIADVRRPMSPPLCAGPRSAQKGKFDFTFPTAFRPRCRLIVCRATCVPLHEGGRGALLSRCVWC